MPLAPLALGLALLAPSPTDIVLARSIGPVTLGQRRAQVEARIGKGKLTSVVNGDLGRFVRYRYDRVRLIVTYRSVGGSVPTAVAVTTNSTRYSTAKGMRVGLRKGPLRKAYPAI